ncbi:MAG: dihydrofolate reductase family protein [Bacteroidetes bacterium]|nr:dihydrofolate reductase family protein [Bacteroidota bacterium]
MCKLIVFNMVSLDGYFVDGNGSMDWTRAPRDNDAEFNEFVQNNAKGGGQLLFGRKTYDLMVSHWLSPAAIKNDPVVAEGMNNMPKVVFSRKMDRATWNNTKLVKDSMVEEVRKMKKQAGRGMVIMGSGEIISQLAQEGLIDEYQILVIPVVLGKGRTMFEGVKDRVSLKLAKSRTFANGNVFLCYETKKETPGGDL